MKLLFPALALATSVASVASAQQPYPYPAPQQPYPAQPYAPQQPYQQPYYGYPQQPYVAPQPQPVAPQPQPVAPQPQPVAPQPQPEAPAPPRDVQGSVGIRIFGGANHYTTPDGVTPAGFDGLGFAGDAGGFGWGAGFYAEGRFVQYLGVELGVLYDHSELRRDVTYTAKDSSGTRIAQVREQMIMKTWRLDLLAKGILPFSAGRVWAGLGPEFVLSSSAAPSNTFTDGGQYFSPSERTAIENEISANEKKSVLLALATGLVINAGDVIEVPIELRVLRTLNQGSSWDDRVPDRTLAPSQDLNPGLLSSYAVNAQNTWEYRLALGIGARF